MLTTFNEGEAIEAQSWDMRSKIQRINSKEKHWCSV